MGGKSITVSEEPIYVERNTEEYVLAGPGFEPQPPAWGPVLTSVPVRSAIALPWPATLPTGPQTIRGFAWSGYGSITRVEYSLDDGRTWADAEIREPNIPLAGCRWEFLWDAPPGEGHHHHPRHRQLGEDAAHARHHALEPARLRVLGGSPPPRPRGVARHPASPGGEADA